MLPNFSYFKNLFKLRRARPQDSSPLRPVIQISPKEKETVLYELNQVFEQCQAKGKELNQRLQDNAESDDPMQFLSLNHELIFSTDGKNNSIKVLDKATTTKIEKIIHNAQAKLSAFSPEEQKEIEEKTLLISQHLDFNKGMAEQIEREERYQKLALEHPQRKELELLEKLMYNQNALEEYANSSDEKVDFNTLVKISCQREGQITGRSLDKALGFCAKSSFYNINNISFDINKVIEELIGDGNLKAIQHLFEHISTTLENTEEMKRMDIRDVPFSLRKAKAKAERINEQYKDLVQQIKKSRESLLCIAKYQSSKAIYDEIHRFQRDHTDEYLSQLQGQIHSYNSRNLDALNIAKLKQAQVLYLESRLDSDQNKAYTGSLLTTQKKLLHELSKTSGKKEYNYDNMEAKFNLVHLLSTDPNLRPALEGDFGTVEENLEKLISFYSKEYKKLPSMEAKEKFLAEKILLFAESFHHERHIGKRKLKALFDISDMVLLRDRLSNINYQFQGFDSIKALTHNSVPGVSIYGVEHRFQGHPNQAGTKALFLFNHARTDLAHDLIKKMKEESVQVVLTDEFKGVLEKEGFTKGEHGIEIIPSDPEQIMQRIYDKEFSAVIYIKKHGVKDKKIYDETRLKISGELNLFKNSSQLVEEAWFKMRVDEIVEDKYLFKTGCLEAYIDRIEADAEESKKVG